jgi:hypothetical protein
MAKVPSEIRLQNDCSLSFPPPMRLPLPWPFTLGESHFYAESNPAERVSLPSSHVL